MKYVLTVESRATSRESLEKRTSVTATKVSIQKGT